VDTVELWNVEVQCTALKAVLNIVTGGLNLAQLVTNIGKWQTLCGSKIIRWSDMESVALPCISRNLVADVDMDDT